MLYNRVQLKVAERVGNRHKTKSCFGGWPYGCNNENKNYNNKTYISVSAKQDKINIEIR